MEEPGIDEQLKAIEAALDLAQARSLPAVVKTESLPVDPKARHNGDGSRELALSILKQMGERMSHLEAQQALNNQHQMIAEALHREEREAIEFISDELATLKKRSARFEQWLSQMQNEVLPGQHIQRQMLSQQPKGNQTRPMLFAIGLAALALITFLFVLFRGF